MPAGEKLAGILKAINQAQARQGDSRLYFFFPNRYNYLLSRESSLAYEECNGGQDEREQKTARNTECAAGR